MITRKQLKKIRNKKALQKFKNIQKSIQKYQGSPKRELKEDK